MLGVDSQKLALKAVVSWVANGWMKLVAEQYMVLGCRSIGRVSSGWGASKWAGSFVTLS